jgi:prepilin-type processing-associated H-X9-DG protein
MPAQNIKSYIAAAAAAAAVGFAAPTVASAAFAATPAPASASTWQRANAPSDAQVIDADLYSVFGDGSVSWIRDTVASAPVQQIGNASGGEVVTLAFTSAHTQGSNSVFGDGSVRFITE